MIIEIEIDTALNPRGMGYMLKWLLIFLTKLSNADIQIKDIKLRDKDNK